MSTYVLEFLDGSQKGTVFPLAAARVTLGRRPDNDLAVHDDKCSGHHAEIVLEEGRYVLRDVGSRNGTLLDGRKIEEVVLSPFDVFQIGRTQIVFRQEGQQMAVDDLHVATLDRSAVARRGGRRRRPLGAIAVLVLLLGGGGAWAWFRYFGDDAGGGVARAPAEPLVVAGNLIRAGAGSFEEDGLWVLSALEAAGFEIAVGRGAAHTGTTAIEAVFRKDEDGTAQRLALAQLADPIQVTAESKLELSGFLATEGSARAALRLAFHSTADDAELLTGTVPASFDGWTRAATVVAVPRGVDRVEVQVLALLPDDGARVVADDVALVVARDAAVEPISLSTDNGRLLSAAGGGMRITTGPFVVLHGVRPAVDDPLLQELDRYGELAPSDAGLALEVELLDRGAFALRYRREGELAKGLVLDFPAAGGDPIGRPGGDAPFARIDAGLAPEPMTDVILGSEATRCALEFAEPAPVSVTVDRGLRSVRVGGVLELTLAVRFEAAAKAARELVREATTAKRQHDYEKALDAIRLVVERYPHDDRLVRDAGAIRVELLGELGQRAEDVRWDGAVAEFFGARVGFERVAAEIAALIDEFGEQHVPQLEALRELEARMRAGIERLDRAAGEEHRAALVELADAFDDAGRDALSVTIRGYVERHYPNPGEEKR